MSIHAMERLLDLVDEIPPLPTVAQELTRMASSDDFSASEIGAVIAQDPAISAKLLRIANSPIYSPRVPVTEVSRAVMTLGNAGVVNLVLGICASVAIAARDEETLRIHEFLWSHAIAVATLAQLLGRSLELRQEEELFTAGMFVDLGLLASTRLLPAGPRRELFGQLVDPSLPDAERRETMAHAAELGHRVLRAWQIPESLRGVSGDPSAFRPARDGTKQQVLRIACDVVECKGWALPSGEFVAGRAARDAHALGLDEGTLRDALFALRERFDVVTESLGCAGILRHPAERTEPRVLLLVGELPDGELDLLSVLFEEHGFVVQVRAPRELAYDDVQDGIVLDRDGGTSLEARRQRADALRGAGARKVFVLHDAGSGVLLGEDELPRFPRMHELWKAGLCAHAPLHAESIFSALRLASA